MLPLNSIWEVQNPGQLRSTGHKRLGEGKVELLNFCM